MPIAIESEYFPDIGNQCLVQEVEHFGKIGVLKNQRTIVCDIDDKCTKRDTTSETWRRRQDNSFFTSRRVNKRDLPLIPKSSKKASYTR
ncbi:hypothetical protein CEXT_479381 [Caerostris extrusa]|uniref:Uncharacterized protein n=1 Tax=Caerostris extrusa TaxID=172846 RepID=A0AAV4PZI1_CAEEX|nr:hypothetical protein CEXT_479381 [Caerostris extrusa]